MLNDAKRLAKRGVAIHWLRSESKAPVDSKWSTAEVNSPRELEDTYREGYNVGARPGEPSEVDKGLFLYWIDVDVKGGKKDAEEAFDWLDKNIPDWEKYPFVQSGRGGDSQHIVVASRAKLPSKKLAHSDRKVEWTDAAGKTHKSWAWEIERFGTGKQVAIPPSIHPETKNPYKWGREIDWDDLDAITIDLEDIAPSSDESPEESESRGSTRDDDSSGSLSDFTKRRILDISTDDAWKYLLDLSHAEYCDDRDGWLKVGMALHHEFEGGSDGLDLWHDWSKRSDKYDGDDLERVWESFGKDKRRRPVRFATLIHAGAHKRLRREYSGAEIEDPLDDDDDPDAWVSQLSLSEKGSVESTSDNLALIVANDVRFKGIFGLNRFVHDTSIVKRPGVKKARSEKKQARMRQLSSWLWELDETQAREGRILEDDHYHEIRACIEAPVSRGGYRMKVTDRDLSAAIQIAANNAPYHPIQNYLETLEWDGKNRMDTLFADYLGTEDDEYHSQCGSLWLTAAVARAYQPGHKFDFVPILEGKQGTRKSTFIERLALHWFVELRCEFGDPKKVVETLMGSWIAEIPELHQMTKSEVTEVKAFFSAKEEKVREAYGRKSKHFKRQSVYMGTTNNREYLRDPTGNRRFWPIQCGNDLIDTDRLKRNVEQIWAEAVVRYKQMLKDHPNGQLPLYLKGEQARARALELQESRMIETQADGWAGLIEQWANTRVRESEIEGLGDDFARHDGKSDPLVRRELICGLQVWVEALKGSNEAYGRGNTIKVIEAIRRTGEWEDAGRQRMPVYGLQRVFKRVANRKTRLLD